MTDADSASPTPPAWRAPLFALVGGLAVAFSMPPWGFWPLAFVGFALFDAVVESFAVGARKPERAIYEATADMLAVDHPQVVYLDDFEQNLDTADALGWTTILVHDHLEAIAELDVILGRSSYDRK